MILNQSIKFVLVIELFFLLSLVDFVLSPHMLFSFFLSLYRLSLDRPMSSLPVEIYIEPNLFRLLVHPPPNNINAALIILFDNLDSFMPMSLHMNKI